MNKELFELKKYIEYFKIGFKTSVEYKSYILGALITPAFMGFFFYFIWSYIYDVRYTAALEEGIFLGGFSSFTIGGFTFEEMLVYLLIGLLFSVVRSTQISDDISEKIRSGDISIFLCRPVSFIKSIVFQGFGLKVINLLIFAVLLVAMTVILQLPNPPLTILMIFLAYAILMIIFDIFLYIMIGGLSFWFVEIWGIRASIEQVLWILSGRVLPLTLFPQIMQSILVFTPFLYLEFTFASLYLGKLTVLEALRAMGIFTIWIVLMGVGVWYLYKKGFEKVSSFGG